MDWWKTFFNAEFYGPHLESIPQERTVCEVDFMLSALKIRKRAAVLDLCCGIGRHAIELARRGYRVTGLDYTPGYLETARRKAKEVGVKIKFIRGDMRRIPGEKQFDVVINIFTSFGFFEKDAENFKVLSSVSRCLMPGGKFLLDTMNRDWLIKNFQEMRWSDGSYGTVLEKSSLDPREDLVATKFIWLRNGERTEHDIQLKLYPYSTYKRELKRQGLFITDGFGDFDGNEFSIDSRRMIIIAVKK